MEHRASSNQSNGATLERPFDLELADGTRLVPEAEARPACLQADPSHAFTLADVQRAGGEPFQGYRLISD